MSQLNLFPVSPLFYAEPFEYFPENRWVQLHLSDYANDLAKEEACGGIEDEEQWQNDLAFYIATEATQDEMREWVWNELGVNVRRVYPSHPDDGVAMPGWIYLDYGITLVKTVPHQTPPPGGLTRDEIRDLIKKWHAHYPKTSHLYHWGYAIYNGPPEAGRGNMIGVALVGYPAQATETKAKRGEGPRIATVLKVAINRDVPKELTYKAVGSVYNDAAKGAYEQGFDFLETYTLFSESGRSLHYANWSAPGISKTQSRWRKTGISPARKKGRRGERRESDEPKWRWWKRLTDKWPMPKAKKNPDVRPCGSLPDEVDLHRVGPVLLVLDAHNVRNYDAELFAKGRCPLLAGFREGDREVSRPGVVVSRDLPTSNGELLLGLARRIGLHPAEVERKLVEEGRAWWGHEGWSRRGR